MAFAHDADPRFGQFTLRTDCPKCGSNLPVNGPVAEVDCADCSVRVRVPEGLLRDLVDTFEDRWPAERVSDTITLGDLTWRWSSLAVEAPTCHACGAALPEGGKAITCVCGVTTFVLPAVDPIRTGAHSARKVYRSDPEDRPVVTAAPVAMSCPQCGAGLTITGMHQRLTPCGHCGVTVHLPDSVWRQLHPARVVLPWTVRFEGESRAARRRREAEEKATADRRKREARAEGEARRKEAEAARDAKNAAEAKERKQQKDRERAEAYRRHRMKTLPVVLLAWVLTPAALGAMGVATAWYMMGTPPAVAAVILPTVLPYAPRIGVFAALALALFAWGVASVAAAWRTRQSVGELLPLSIFYLVTASMPVAGWFFGLVWAFKHATGTEPTLEETKTRVPWTVGLPLALLLLAASVYTHVVVAAGTGISLGELWDRIGESE